VRQLVIDDERKIGDVEATRKLPAFRYAETNASWTASAASSGSPSVRRATAHIRSRCRLTISLNA